MLALEVTSSDDMGVNSHTCQHHTGNAVHVKQQCFTHAFIDSSMYQLQDNWYQLQKQWIAV